MHLSHQNLVRHAPVAPYLVRQAACRTLLGATGTCRTKWSQNNDCCTWSGVDCDEAGRVIGLDLSEESISAGIDNSSSLFSLEYLQSLNLAFNMFNATEIPSGFRNLTNLTTLNLSNAGFVGQIPIQVSGMTRLVTLDLSSLYRFGAPLKLENPNLSGLLQNLAELRELYLDGANISAPGIEWCQALSSLVPKLQVLSLSCCYLSGLIHPSLAKLQSLSVIRLDQNDLLSPIPEFLADFFNLTSLRLSSTQLNGRFPEKILQVHTLQTLDLSDNSLLQGSLPDFPKNSSLRTLMLSYTNFSARILCLDESRISDDAISEMERVSTAAMADLKAIADYMISAGYRKECWGRDEREGYFGLKDFFMANVDRNLFGGLRWKKPKFLWLLV